MGYRNSMPDGRWDEAMSAAGYRCQMSETSFPTKIRCSGRLVVHHRLTRGAGGTRDESIHDLGNLMVLCGGVTGRDGHHGEVHDFPALSYEHGLLIRRNSVRQG